MDELISLGVAALDSGDPYYVESHYQSQLAQAHRQAVERAREAIPPSFNAILDGLGIRFNDRTTRLLLPYITPMLADDVDSMICDRPTVRWWGKYMAACMPAYDGSVMTGMWLITRKGAHFVQSNKNFCRSTTHVGLAHTVRHHDPEALVTDDPVQALRFAFWGAAETGRVPPILLTFGMRPNIDQCAARTNVFFSPTNDLGFMVRSLDVDDSRLLLNDRAWDELRQFPYQGNFPRFWHELRHAPGAHLQVANHLLRLPRDQALADLAGQRLTSANQSRILAHLTGDDQQYVQRLLSQTTPSAAIVWNDQVVTDTPAGWACGGRVVSSVKLVLEQVRPVGETGDAVVTGTLTYHDPRGERHSLPFRDNLDAIRKNPGEWAIRRVVAGTGALPYIEPAWMKRLLEIAQRFHQPKAVLPGQQYGWLDGVLRMPSFTVDRDGLYNATGYADGPALPLPDQLSPAELDSFRSPGFCRLFLLLLGNLIRTARGVGGLSIAVVNEPHLVTRLAAAFGTDVLVNPSIVEVQTRTGLPLPMFAQWSGTGLRAVIESTDGPKNLMLSVDQHTARLLSLYADWQVARVGDLPDYRSMRQIFLSLPAVLRRRPTVGPTMWRDIASVVSEQTPVDGSRLVSVASALDSAYASQLSGSATKFLELILYGVERQQIHPVMGQDTVEILHSEFRLATASPIVPLPGVDAITDVLREARFLLLSTGKDRWAISRSVWDLTSSLVLADR